MSDTNHLPRPIRARDTHDEHLSPLQISTYADGETPPAERAGIEAHLASCASCAATLERLRATAVMISSLPRTTPSAGVFEKVLAGARQMDGAPGGVSREGMGRRAHGPVRLREVRIPDMDTPASAPLRRRSVWRAPLTSVMPTLAALLLLAFTAGLLVRASFSGIALPVANPTTTIAPGDTLNTTQHQIAAIARQVSFTPVAPTYLPYGARLDSVHLVTPSSGKTYLDVTWVMTAGPLRELHLREQAPGEPISGFSTQSLTMSGMAWQVGESAAWSPMELVEGPGWHGVRQERPNVTLLLDARPAPGASASDVAAALRLTSLSLDAAYAPPSVAITAPAPNALVRAQALVTGAGRQSWSWDLTLSPDPNSTYRRSTIAAPGVSVTEITYAGVGTLLDNAHKVYQHVSGTIAPTPPPANVTQIAFDADSFLATGQLWNLGPITVDIPGLGKRHVYDLYRVDTMRPEHVYVDATSGAVLAIWVDTTARIMPGGPGSPQPYVSTMVCQPYTVTYQWLIYEPASQAVATFDATPPTGNGWSAGSVAPPFSC